MSLDEQKRFLKDVLDEIEIHKDLYRFVEFKSVIAKREDVPGREGKWHNFVTLIKLTHSGNSRPCEKALERNNFAILSAIITIKHFKEILERLVNDHVLEVDGCPVYGPFIFGQKDFLDSKQSKRSYDIDWAVNLWRVTGKDNLGLPNSKSLELESEDVPFSDPKDAIRFYTGISLQSDSNLQNAIHIAAPLYCARIEKAELSDRDLLIEIDSNLVGSRNLRIKYNTEGPDERSQYYKTLEAGTVQPTDNATTVQLKENAEVATVWLYHKAGFKIDSRRVRRRPLIKDLENRLSQDTSHLWDKDVDVITAAIISTSKTRIPDLVTTELSVDSIDVEILKSIKIQGGDYAKFIPEVLKYLSLNMLLSRLARLRILGFITLQSPRKILLTSHGVDALNLPPTVLSSKVPSKIDKRIAEIRSAFRKEDYDEVTNKSTKLLETILREELEDKFRGTLQDVWPNLKLEPYDRASLGTLKDACLRLKVFKKNSIVDHLLGTILKLRVPMSHEKEETVPPSEVASLTAKLVEAFIRNWYYIRL